MAFFAFRLAQRREALFDSLVRKGRFLVRVDLEELSLQDKLKFLRSSGETDLVEEWLPAQNFLLGSIFAVAYLVMPEITVIAVLIPFGAVGVIAVLFSVFRSGLKAPGIRLGLFNIFVVCAIGGSLAAFGRLSFASVSFNDWYRWLWTPVGGFSLVMVGAWLLMQIQVFFPRLGLAGIALASGKIMLCTAVLGVIWLRVGGYPKEPLFSAYALIGIVQFIQGVRLKWNRLILSGAFVVLGCTAIAYWASENPDRFDGLHPGSKHKNEVAEVYRSLWPTSSRETAEGYLESETGEPIRLVAAGPDICLFSTKDRVYPREVVGTMIPWVRYYAFGKADACILIGLTRETPADERVWVAESECYVMRTSFSLKINRPSKIYPSIDSAQADQNPVHKRYNWSGLKPNRLPVVQKSGEYCRFVRPDGVAWGFPLCWVRLDGRNLELEDYTNQN